MPLKKTFTLADQIIEQVDHSVRTLFSKPQSQRAYPAAHIAKAELSVAEQKHISGLMRVNHSGEVCAQALYHAQALTGKSESIKERMHHAAKEEDDHLNWCENRLRELNSRKSLLNPVWYIGSFAIGAIAGFWGDKWNLGFVQETEKQVVNHLQGHIEQISSVDAQTCSILEQMKQDEQAHADMAELAGASDLPKAVKHFMKLSSKIMTKVSYHI